VRHSVAAWALYLVVWLLRPTHDKRSAIHLKLSVSLAQKAVYAP
jgi:hypothetical protein